MKKRLEIKRLGINGEGIGYLNRKVVFVKGALTGEEVEVDVKSFNRQFLTGQLLKIIRPSKSRRQISCRANKECLGCSLLHMDYPTQLQYKKNIVRESIRKYTQIDLDQVVFKDIIPNTIKQGFIQDVNLPIVNFKGKVTFGIYQRQTKYLIVMTHCFKQHPLINRTLEDLEVIFNEEKCKTYHEKFKTGLRFIKLKVINDQVQIVIITGKDGLKKSVSERITKLKQVCSLYLSINTTRHQDFDEAGYTKLYGLSKLEFYHQDQKYLVSVKSPLPHHFDAYFRRNEAIKSMLKESEKILSVYSGLGVLELELDQEVIGFDDQRSLVDDANLNAKYLKKDQVRFIYGNVEERIIPYAKKKIYDTFIIQNERNGISEQLKDTLRLSKVENVIYVSLNHSTMAKDLNDLQKYFKVERIVGIDEFVYQPSVTTVVKLKRK